MVVAAVVGAVAGGVIVVDMAALVTVATKLVC